MSDTMQITAITLEINPEDYRFPAVESLGGGSEVVFVKDGKILKGVRPFIYRDGEIRVNLSESLYDEMITPIKLRYGCAEPDTAKQTMHPAKFLVLGFSKYSGTFLTSNIEHGPIFDAVDALFENIRIVDHFRLRYGMVPKTFADVEDYRSAIDE